MEVRYMCVSDPYEPLDNETPFAPYEPREYIVGWDARALLLEI